MTAAALPKVNHFICSSPECEGLFSVLVTCGPLPVAREPVTCEDCGAQALWVTGNDFKLLEGIAGLPVAWTGTRKAYLESVLEVSRLARKLVREIAQADALTGGT